MYACTSSGDELVPMVLKAIETPIESPAPVVPALMAADSAATIALIADVALAVIETASWLVTLLVSMYAFVCVKTLLKATAPAPLTAPLKPALNATDRDAAAV